jgi:hypothetical protein
VNLHIIYPFCTRRKVRSLFGQCMHACSLVLDQCLCRSCRVQSEPTDREADRAIGNMTCQNPLWRVVHGGEGNKNFRRPARGAPVPNRTREDKTPFPIRWPSVFFLYNFLLFSPRTCMRFILVATNTDGWCRRFSLKHETARQVPPWGGC